MEENKNINEEVIVDEDVKVEEAPQAEEPVVEEPKAEEAAAEEAAPEEDVKKFADDIVEKIKEMVKEGNVSRIRIRKDGSRVETPENAFNPMLPEGCTKCERLNGIRLSTGADLFEERLHLRGNVTSIQWQAHSDWDWNLGGIQDAAISEDVWNAFLDAMDAGQFVDTHRPDGEPFYEGRAHSSVYDTPNQAHLFLTMTDGTRVELRLIEGGYVGYAPLGWYFVRIPGEAFDAVYTACGGAHETGW